MLAVFKVLLRLGQGNLSIEVEVGVDSYKEACVQGRKRLEVFFTLTDNDNPFAFQQWQKNVPYRLKVNDSAHVYLTNSA
jgi:hypothetical protein